MFVRTVTAGNHGTALWLWCPGCDDLHNIYTGGTEGAQWEWNGDVERPTISPSILVLYGRISGVDKRCHSFVRDGRWEFRHDSTHPLAGQAVDVVPIPDGWFE